MLSRLGLRNFRCLKEVDIKLTPLTFIVGPNGSGKSSILLAIQLLKQSIGTSISYNGEFASLKGFKETVLNGNEDEWVSIKIGAKPSNLVRKTVLTYSNYLKTNGYNPLFREVEYELSFRKDEVKQSFFLDDQVLLSVAFVLREGSWRGEVQSPRMFESAMVTDASRVLIWGAFHFDLQGVKAETGSDDGKSLMSICAVLNSYLLEVIRSVHYISTLRDVNAERVHDSFLPQWVGRRGEHTVGLLALIFGSREHEEMREKIRRWATAFGLKDLQAGWRGRTELSADYKDPKTQAVLDVSSAGYGSAQILPIITQLFWSTKNSTICFEEPESSLHLELVTQLAHMLAEIVHDGKQAIATTHEQNLFFALKPLIDQKTQTKINPEDVAVYELKKTCEGSTAERLEITSEGTIKGGISSFVEAEKNLVYQWMYTIPEAEKQEEKLNGQGQ